jgi:indole-3-glycerol phosphate synthase
MTSVLAAIVAAARRAAAERERRDGAATEREAARRTSRGALFEARLRRPGVNLIAECKRRSPSKGVLRHAYDPAAIARAYEQAGAAAVSVLTEPTFFDGSVAHLASVRAAVSIPVLRKDFVTTPFEIIEARATGADAVLLIVAVLARQDLRTLIETATAHGLAALVEVHTARELAVAVEAGATLVGVNARDLHRLDVSLQVFDDLAPHIPSSLVAVAESGLREGADLARLARAGYRGFLIGERFMTDLSPGEAAAGLLQDAARALEGAAS